MEIKNCSYGPYAERVLRVYTCRFGSVCIYQDRDNEINFEGEPIGPICRQLSPDFRREDLRRLPIVLVEEGGLELLTE